MQLCFVGGTMGGADQIVVLWYCGAVVTEVVAVGGRSRGCCGCSLRSSTAPHAFLTCITDLNDMV